MGKYFNILDFSGKKLLHTTALVSVIATPHEVALANPAGGVTTAGSANISQSGNNTTINQSSDRAVIRWDSFNLGSSDSVNFVAPSSNSITINRIRDNNPSSIDGSISANGKIILINPNGIVFGAGSKVDAAALVATTSDVDSDDAFMAGGAVKFTRPGKFDASIINNGLITVKEAGLVGLVAPHVENNGIIRARLGRVQLASGDISTIDLAGDGLIKLEVSNNVVAQSIKNTGTIEADGGDVLITAAQARNAVDALITHTGSIRANSIGGIQGHVVLSTKGLDNNAADRGLGTIMVSGTISASGLNAGEKGGSIIFASDRIALTDDARAITNGMDGGGDILVGGNFHGAAGMATASQVFIGNDAVLSASALQNGQGGNIALWSDDRTQFFGQAFAQGGVSTGDGGFVEVSSENHLDFEGMVHLLATEGQTGTLLLDPTDIAITASPDNLVSSATPFAPTIDDGPSNLNITTLTTALAGGNVIVQTRSTGTQLGDITIGTGITWASGSTLTLNADHDVIVNSAISGQSLTLLAGNDIQLNSNISGSGTLTIQSNNTAAGIGLGTAQAGSLNLSNTELGHITNGWSNIIVGRTNQTGDINVGANTWNDNLTLQTGTGAIKINGATVMGSNDLNVTTVGGPITLASTLSQSTGTMNFTSGAGALNLNGAITKTSGTINLNSTTGAIAVGATLNAGSSALNITTDANPAITAALIGTGTLTLVQNSVGTTMGLGNAQAGTVNLDGTELGFITNGWANLIFGRTDGTGAINVGANTWNDNLTLQTGGGAINLNGATVMGANNLTVNSNGGNIALSNTLSQSTGTMAFNSVTGTLTLNGAITKTSGTINLNSTTGAIAIGAALNGGSSALNITTDANPAITAALSGTGTLTLAQKSIGTTMGLGPAQTGIVNLDGTELGFITNGWSNLVFGRTDGTGAINVGANTWNDNLTLQTGTGAINLNGAQTMGANDLSAISAGGNITVGSTIGQSSGAMNLSSGSGALSLNGAITKTSGTINLTSDVGVITVGAALNAGSSALNITTDANIALNASLIGTGILSVMQNSAGTTMGLGNAQTGTVNLDATELGNITNGWSGLVFGRTNGVGTINVGTMSWNDFLTLQTGIGTININGAQTMGANNLTMTTAGGAMNVNGTLTQTSGTMTLNSGAGIITINNAIDVGSGNLTITTDADPTIAAALTGTGTFTLAQATATTGMGLGNAQAGSVLLNNAELANITDGWSSLIFGRTDGSGAINVGANAWNDNLTVQNGAGTVNINGAQTMGANNLALTTVGGTLAISAAAPITQSTGTISMNTGTGALNLNGAITKTSGTINLNSTSGVITVGGVLNAGSSALNITTDANPAITAALTGTGIFTLAQASAATMMGLGGAAGTVNMDGTELGFITNGWANLIFGRTDGTGLMTVGANSWNDFVTLQNGTGNINVTGAQTLGANNLTVTTTTGAINVTGTLTQTSGTMALSTTTGVITAGAAIAVGSGNLNITTDGNPVITAALTGTGNLTISNATVAGTMGLGGGTGSLNIDATELTKITNGWTNIIFGRTDGTGAMNVAGTNTWNDNLTLQNGIGAINIAGAQTMGGNDLTVTTVGGVQTLTGTIAQSGGAMNFNSGTGAMNLNGTITKTGGTSVNLNSTTGVISIGAILDAGASAANITTNADLALTVANALTGTGILTVSQASAGTTMGLGGGAGTVNLSATEITDIKAGWANLIFGRTDGTGLLTAGAATWTSPVLLRNGMGAVSITGTQTVGANNFSVTTAGGAITVGGNITGAGDTVNLTSGTGLITINNAIAVGTGGNMTITTDNDLVLNNNLSGTGTLTITSGLAGTSIGLGDTQTGTLNLTTAEVGRITNGWSSLLFGNATNTADINVGALTWNDNLTLRNGAGAVKFNGALAMGANTLTATTTSGTITSTAAGTITGSTGAFAFTTTGGNIAIGGAITETTGGVTLNSGSGSIATTAAINGTTGTTSLTTTGGAITVGGNINRVGGTATFSSGAGLITINNAVAVGASGNINITTDNDLVLSADLSGTGTLTVLPALATTSIGLGTGQAGTLNFTDAELNHIVNGWGNLFFGATTGTGVMNVGAYSWQDNLTLRTATGQMNLNGNQALNGNNLTITTDSDLLVGGTLTSAGGNLILSQQSNNISMGVGTGQTGTFGLSDTELDNIVDGWGGITLGNKNSSAVMNIGTRTWLDPLTLLNGSGQMTIAGAQTMGANNLTISTDSNLALNGALTGTGILTIQPSATGTSMGLAGGAGTLNLTVAELNNITDGWSNIIMGTTSMTNTMNVNAYTWKDNLDLRTSTGVMTIAGAQTMGANNLTLRTNSNLALNGALTGTGSLNILTANNSTSMGIGTGQAGTLSLTDPEVAQITNGWSNIILGSNAQTGAITVGAQTWNDPLQIQTSTATGIITIAGAQNMGANNLTIMTDANPVINAPLSGTGKLFIQGTAITTAIGLGTGQPGTLLLDNVELGNLLAGWNEIDFGSDTMTGAMTIGANNWQYNTHFISNTGVITVVGAQNAGGNSLVFETNGNLTLNSTLAGTGDLTIMGASPGTTIGLAGGAGTLNLTTAELNNIVNGWSNLNFGDTTETGAMTISTYLGWNDNVKFSTGSGVISAAAQTVGANNLTFETDGDLALTGNMTGTGTLIIEGASLATVIGVGASQTGSLQLSAADLAKINNGWGGVQIGRQDATGDVNIGTNTWANKTTFITRGNINLNGTTTSSLGAGTNLVFATGGAFINNVGAAAINPGSGRYLVYSVAPGSNTLNGLTPSNTVNSQTYFSYAPSAVTETGNVYIYSNGAVKILYIQADNKVKVYGDAVPILTYTYLGGLQGGDTLSAALLSSALSAVGAQTTDNVGVTRVITGTFSTGLGYTVQLVDGTLSVTKAPILVQANTATRIYGDADPAFTFVYTGFKNGETSAVIDTLPTATTPATATSNVGTYVITPNGGADNNYTFNYSPNNMTITKAPVTVTVQDATRIYGDADPAFSVAYTGFKNTDTSSVVTGLSLTTPATATSNVGNYAINGATATATNYSFTYMAGNLSITPATISVTVDPKSRQYGVANPALTGVLSGFKNTDTSSVVSGLVYNTTAGLTSDVGSYAITAGGATATNYVFTYTPSTMNVTQAQLTATVQNITRDYGDANPSLSVVYTGFKNGEDESVIDTKAVTATTTDNLTNAGTYTDVLTASGAADHNYTFVYDFGDLTVSKVALTATTQNATREYGDADPPLSVIYTGFKNGEDDSVIDTRATPTSGTAANTDVGTYTISSSGALDNNYTFTYANTGNLTITQAHLTATTQDATRHYGDADPPLNVVYTGFKNGEDESVIDVHATPSSGTTGTTNVGTGYVITASGAVDHNYDFTYNNSGHLTITKATLTATTQDATREYGDANPALSVVYTGFKNGEDESVIDVHATLSTTAVPTTDVGSYAITAMGASDSNYDFTYANTGNLAITQAQLTATVHNITRDYGDANPPLTVVYTGFKNGEDDSVIDTKAVTATTTDNLTNAGTYTDALTASGAVDHNYTFVYDFGDLTVNKVTLTATTQNATREYGDADPALNVVYTGFKNGEDDSVIDTRATPNSGTVANTDVGTYTITSGGAIDNNYDFAYANTGQLTITQAHLTVQANDDSREYGSANPGFTIVYTGFKNGEDQSVIDTHGVAVTTADNFSNVGDYAITTSGAVDHNYDFTYNPGTLHVTKATLTATAQNASRDYGDANPGLTIVYTGFKNGENQGVIDILGSASTVADNLSNVNTYAITATGAADTNYNFNYVDGTLTINKATVTATVQDATREYGDANPGFAIVYTGFKNGQDDSIIDVLANASTTAIPTTNVGSYAIMASGAIDTNYDFTYTSGNLVITKATLAATTQDGTRAYGNANPVFGIVYTGFKNGEDESVINTKAHGSSADHLADVGTYAITGSGGVDNNYDFNYVDTGNLTITKATLTVRPRDVTRLVGADNPTVFAIGYTGFKNGENASILDTAPTATSMADASALVGNYAITASGAADGNYNFAYVDGVLSVVVPDLTPDIPSTVETTVRNVTTQRVVTSNMFKQLLPLWHQDSSSTLISYQDIVLMPERDLYQFDYKNINFLIAVTDDLKQRFLLGYADR